MIVSVYPASISTSTISSNSGSRWNLGGSSSISSGGGSSNSPRISPFGSIAGVLSSSIAKAGWASRGPAIIESNTLSKGFDIPTSTDTAFFAASPLLSRASLIVASFTGSATFGSVVMLRSCRASRSEAISKRKRALAFTAGAFPPWYPQTVPPRIAAFLHRSPFRLCAVHCRSGTSEIDQSRGLSLRSRMGLVFGGFSVILSPAVFCAKWQNTSRSHGRHLNDTPGRYLTERRAHRGPPARQEQDAGGSARPQISPTSRPTLSGLLTPTPTSSKRGCFTTSVITILPTKPVPHTTIHLVTRYFSLDPRLPLIPVSPFMVLPHQLREAPNLVAQLVDVSGRGRLGDVFFFADALDDP